jgi:hypothetical protein
LVKRCAKCAAASTTHHYQDHNVVLCLLDNARVCKSSGVISSSALKLRSSAPRLTSSQRFLEDIGKAAFRQDDDAAASGRLQSRSWPSSLNGTSALLAAPAVLPKPDPGPDPHASFMYGTLVVLDC